MNRVVAHMDLDTFFVSVERLKNTALVGKPIIVGGLSDRGVVSACSYETRKFGVSSGMAIKMARRLCPNAVFIRGDFDQYSRYSAMVTEIISEQAPVVEKASIDEHYLDLSGMDRFFGTQKWLHELRTRIIRETGLPISCGLSVNKTVSKIATGEAKPNGEKNVELPMVKPFLNPLSIRKIPGIGEKAYHTLRDMGIVYIGTLSAMPQSLMQQVMGENGVHIWEKANGIDMRPVQPYSERKSIGAEETFETDTTDMKLLQSTLIRMVQETAFEMRSQNRLCGCVTVKLRYSDFQTQTKQIRIPYTSYDHKLLKTALDLFESLYNRRLLVRLIGVKLSHFVYGSQQIDLFEDSLSMVNLYQAMDSIRNWYGKEAVYRAGAILPDGKKGRRRL
ncbi:MAG: DNA polymerase IV [Bacteroidetes bacterium]|nr:DNA polymerase IV [Bacteroidota bacterium]